jgi:alanine dehydrogenase
LIAESLEARSASSARPAVGLVRESNEGERRVALMPRGVASLIAEGVDAAVESGGPNKQQQLISDEEEEE